MPIFLRTDQILFIAQTDALKVYRDLSNYAVRLALEEDGWHVDYELKNPKLKSDGAHYIIDPKSFTIKSKRYEQ